MLDAVWRNPGLQATAVSVVPVVQGKSYEVGIAWVALRQVPPNVFLRFILMNSSNRPIVMQHQPYFQSLDGSSQKPDLWKHGECVVTRTIATLTGLSRGEYMIYLQLLSSVDDKTPRYEAEVTAGPSDCGKRVQIGADSVCLGRLTIG